MQPWDAWIQKSTNQLGSSDVTPFSKTGPAVGTAYPVEKNLAELSQHPLYAQSDMKTKRILREQAVKGMLPPYPDRRGLKKHLGILG